MEGGETERERDHIVIDAFGCEEHLQVFVVVDIMTLACLLLIFITKLMAFIQPDTLYTFIAILKTGRA